MFFLLALASHSQYAGIHSVLAEDECGVVRIDDTRFHVDRTLAETCFAERTDARVVKVFRGRVFRGLKILAIGPGSLYQQLGFRNGDLLVSINGVSPSTPDKALFWYTTLRNSPALELAIERFGVPLILRYEACR